MGPFDLRLFNRNANQGTVGGTTGGGRKIVKGVT